VTSQRRVAPIAVALDAPDLATACAWATAVAPHVAVLKVGLETYLRDGADSVSAISQAAAGGGDRVGGPDLFLDLKLHDIPNTVAGAVRSVAPLRPTYLTVHALGGPAMIEAAAVASPDTLITAVTILTSMDSAAMAAVGIQGTPAQAALRLATMAVDAGARALVCSPLEVAEIRSVVPDEVVLITPGVRPAGAAVADQKRVATPQQALAAGANLLVIGRPITGAQDVGAAAEEIAAGIQA
jgi:orotidine-5'-phosphate decarboxylase